MSNNKRKSKKPKHRLIEVGEDKMISLCETCIHMPSGKVPQNNFQKDNAHPQQPHVYCARKAFFADINYNNEGKPFYDVAICDGYQRIEKSDSKKPLAPEVERYEEPQ